MKQYFVKVMNKDCDDFLNLIVDKSPLNPRSKVDKKSSKNPDFGWSILWEISLESMERKKTTY